MGFLWVINVAMMENASVGDPFARPLDFVHFKLTLMKF